MVIIVVSMMLAMLFMSGGYSFWQSHLTITGQIEIKQKDTVATALTPSALLTGEEIGDIAIPDVSGDQTTGTETIAPINQEDPQTDVNSGYEAAQGETTEEINNPSEQQNNDSAAAEAVETGSSTTDETNSTGDTPGQGEGSSEASASTEASTDTTEDASE